MEQSCQGKKIFILYPHSVIKDELLDILIMAGFESYVLFDHKRALKLLLKYPDSIMFINIDEGMSEREWETYVRGIQEDPETKNCRLGILSYNTDQNLMQKYLMDLSVPCGYIQLKLGIKESTKIMLNVLEANEARGKRKYIRAFCENDISATVNIKSPSGIYYGKLLDISAAGVAARFETIEKLAPSSVVKEMQFKLRGGLVLADAVFMGKRDDQVYIFMFDIPRMNPDHKLIIHRYIKYTLQHYIDNLKL
ncbi:MAG: PilZ domain-containing protein [Treponema sp.]|jgi:L-rhamnose mutarotase|nr:PilZ domain-containing protein [Treponema sp.]